MKLLFITRKYPPSVGGMEKVSYALSQELSNQVPTTIFAWGKSQKWLPFFLPKVFFQSLFVIPKKQVSNIHIGDALLAPLGLGLKLLTRRKVSVTVHGLDITYKNRLYQAVVPACLKRLDKIVCISSATMEECTKRGIPARKCTVIPWGVNPVEFETNTTKADLENLLNTTLAGKKVLLTVGRLVERKGVAWFIENVLTKIGNKYIYAVAGDGPERGKIEQIVEKYDLKNQVRLLGKVSDETKKLLYASADIFVMPNIKVRGDMEGFGIVAVEAASVGLPVVGSDIEGIHDAILQGETGLKIEKSSEWQQSIEKCLNFSRQKVSDAAKAFAWPRIVKEYIRVIL